ncbi:MAG: hypothetical protein ACR2OE_14560, partial [Thermomicrobiales bacterium]
VTLADPVRHPAAIVRDAISSVFSLKDKLLLARWAVECRRADWESAASAATEQGIDRSGLDALRARVLDCVHRSVCAPLLGWDLA